MTFPELDKKFDNVVKDLTSNYNGTIMVKVAINAFSLIRKRVQETGINAKGQRFAPYSTKPSLVGRKSFITVEAGNKVLGSKPKRKMLEWRTVNGHKLAILPGGYKKIRELSGRQTNHVDFSVKNDMWNDIMVDKNPSEKDLISTHSDHVNGIAIIGAKQQKEKDKLKGNTERRGDILDLSEKEIGDLKNLYGLQVLQVFKNAGL